MYTAAAGEGPYTFDAADMGKVIQYAAAVMADGYDLKANYVDNFKSAGPGTEVILTSTEGSPQNRVYMTLHYNQNPSGWNGFTTLADFYAKFDPADKRRGIAAGQYQAFEFGNLLQVLDLVCLPVNKRRTMVPTWSKPVQVFHSSLQLMFRSQELLQIKVIA